MLRNSIAAAIPEAKTREQVANEAGISRVYLQKLIAGESVPSIEIALRLAYVLGKPVNVLFQLDEADLGAKPRGFKRKRRVMAPAVPLGGQNGN